MNRSRTDDNRVDDSLLFDDYFDNYNRMMEENLRHLTSGGNISYFAKFKMALFKNLIRHRPRRILEYGCGIGNNLPFLRNNFPSVPLSGCDTSEKSLEIARKLYPDIDFFLITDTGCAVQQFDCVLVADVLHHIPQPSRDYYLDRILSFLEPGGEIVIFEHNPWNPVTRHLVSTCPFDEHAELLSLRQTRDLLRHHGLTVLGSGYCLYFPEFLKWFARFEHLLSFIPLGGKYYVHAVRNP